MSTTREIIDRLKARGLTSDNQVAAVLGVTRQAVSRWQNGHDTMSLHTLQNAAEELDLSEAEFIELGLRLTIEKNIRRNRDRDFWRRVLKRWKEDVGKLASILLVGLALLTARESAAFAVLDVRSPETVNWQLMYYAQLTRRLGRRLRKLLGCLKPRDWLPIQPAPWARIRSTALALSGSLS